MISCLPQLGLSTWQKAYDAPYGWRRKRGDRFGENKYWFNFNIYNPWFSEWFVPNGCFWLSAETPKHFSSDGSHTLTIVWVGLVRVSGRSSTYVFKMAASFFLLFSWQIHAEWLFIFSCSLSQKKEIVYLNRHSRSGFRNCLSDPIRSKASELLLKRSKMMIFIQWTIQSIRPQMKGSLQRALIERNLSRALSLIGHKWLQDKEETRV